MNEKQAREESKASKEAALSDTDLDKATGGSIMGDLGRMIDRIFRGGGDTRRPTK